jgi:hypothetical protein
LSGRTGLLTAFSKAFLKEDRMGRLFAGLVSTSHRGSSSGVPEFRTITMVNTWEIKVDLDRLSFTTPSSYRTDLWSNEFGIIQNAIRQKTYNGKRFNTIFIDMSICTWIDPLPLLSLLISLAEFNNNNGSSEVIFSGKFSDQKSLLPFLEQEGFFGVFDKLKIRYTFGNMPGSENTKAFNAIRNLKSKLFYTNCSVLAAKIVDLKDLQIDRVVSDLIDNNSKIRDLTPSESYDLIYMKLHHILYELLDNVQRHAYEEDVKCQFAGIYMRYRYGIQNTTIQAAYRKNIEDASKDEKKSHLGILLNDIVTANDGFLEVFIIDSGVGIGETLQGKLKNRKNETYHSAFLGLFQRVYFEGLRSKKSEQNAITPTSGINLIHNLLKSDNDFVFAHEEKMWIGFPARENKSNINKYMAQDRDKDIKGKIIVKGLSWIFRLSWEKKNIRENPEVNFFFKNNPGSKILSHPICEALTLFDAEETEKYRNKSVFINDQRENIEFLKNGKLFGDINKAKYFLWFPQKLSTKNEVIKKIESYADEYLKKFNADGGSGSMQKQSLLLLDIPAHEIVVYINALNNLDLYGVTSTYPMMPNFLQLFKNIIICSKTYEVIAFSVKEKKLKQDKELENGFISCADHNLNIKKAALFLKAHDTYLFWKTIAESPNKNDYFVNADIAWEEGLTIRGYFYFENIIHNHDLYSILHNALERIAGLYPEKNVRFVGSDGITKQVIDELNIKYFDEKTPNQINVNSVFVTGKTSSSLLSKDRDDNNVTVSYFYNKNKTYITKSKEDSPGLILFFWPKNEWISNVFREEKTYKRIENTYMIIKKSESSFIINRQNYDDKKNYKRSIDETYEDIQKDGIGIIRLGHTSYENNHNLYNIKYRTIFTDSSRSGHGFFPYIFAVMFFSLLPSKNGNKRSIDRYIDEINDSTLKGTIKDIYKNNQQDNYCYDSRGVSLIVYPTHNYSSLIMRKIILQLPVSFRTSVIPLNRVPTKNGNVIYITPKSREILEEKINELPEREEGHDVLFFDTMIESGRTRKAIKHILSVHTKKIRNIKMLSVFDSQKLSYRNPDKTRHKAYWRLDLPRLGSKNTCKLCNALSVSNEIIMAIRLVGEKTISSFLTFNEIIKRLKGWQETWQVVPALEYKDFHGISSYALPEMQISSIDEHFSPFIRTNVGLSVYASELEFMDMRDDILEKILNEKAIIESHEMIVLLISFRLLLYGNFSLKSCHIRMLQRLILSLSVMSTNDNKDSYSSLGCLALLTQDIETLLNAILPLLYAYKLDVTENKKNNDLKILLGYLAQKDDKLYIALPYEIINPFDHMEMKEAYTDFHYELIYDRTGNFHTRPLEMLVSRALLKKTPDLKAAHISINIIGEKVNTILSQSPEELKAINDKITGLSGKMWSVLNSKSTTDTEWQEIIHDSNNLIEILKDVHSNYFLPLSPYGEITTLSEKIKKLISEHTGKYRIEGSGNTKAEILPCKVSDKFLKDDIRKPWCFWDAAIEGEFIALLTNVRHCCGKIKTPTGRFAHMFVSIKYSESYCTIILRNLSRNKAEVFNVELLKKSRPELTHIKKLNISIKAESSLCGLHHLQLHHIFDNINEKYYFFTTKLKIPILSKEK